ncbi:hypothetical protein [Erythrobacter sp. HL-111]|uniref:alpha/beta hydrolase family protein n=1 Tax=Erythrobacter sp. HL-111 TaxID=1798193 RepID=UPI000879721E|nr:hypothetical protein [Erythrobacter sp. HL-111]SDS96254.1 Predicted dienelactone hydrolase [Erythrobacter sp. HL-111]
MKTRRRTIPENRGNMGEAGLPSEDKKLRGRKHWAPAGGTGGLSRRAAMAGLGIALATGISACGASGGASAQERLRDRIRRRVAERRGIVLPEPPNDLPRQSVADPRAVEGRFAVIERDGVWTDPARGGRAVPWRAFLPNRPGRAPVALYSHGAGGTRDSGRQYGTHLASHGIASVHLQHPGSDRAAFQDNLRQVGRAIRDPRLAAPRFGDIGFAVAQLQTSRSEISDGINARQLAVYGHSFGAITTLIAAGQRVEGFDRSFALPSLKAAVALSPSPPREHYGDVESAFADMLAPILHITGSQDDAPNGDFDAAARQVPFREINDVDQYFLSLHGANHFTFSGDPNPQFRGRSLAYPGLGRHHGLIKASMLAFFQWTLEGDLGARTFLDDELESFLIKEDVFLSKSAA